MTLTTQGAISYLNDKARETLEVTESTDLHSISLRSTGSIISDMEEYEVRVGRKHHPAYGQNFRTSVGRSHVPPGAGV